MRTKITLVTLLLAMLIPLTINAVSNTAVLFLLIEPSARASAMGEAYVAQVDDAFAGYWNSGAMAFNRKTQFASMYSNWFMEVFNDMYYFHIAGNQFVDGIGNLGVNATYMTYGEQTVTDEDGYEGETFNSYDISVAATYASQLKENIGLGLTFKFILSDLAPETETTSKGQGMSYAFDIGYKHKNLMVEKLDFGLNLQNIGPNMTYLDASNSDPLPMNWRMGLSYRAIESKFNKFTLNTDMNKVLANDDPVYERFFTAWTDDSKKTEIEEIVLGIGAEYVYLDLLSLRTGYIYDKAGDIIGASFGAGFHYTFANEYLVNIDYSFQPGGGMQDYNQTMSIKVEF